MYSISCSVPLSQDANGYILCAGTIQEQAVSGLSLADAQELTGLTLVLFATVFGVLALKKALSF